MDVETAELPMDVETAEVIVGVEMATLAPAVTRKEGTWKGQCHTITQEDENICAMCGKLYVYRNWRKWKKCSFCSQRFCSDSYVWTMTSYCSQYLKLP